MSQSVDDVANQIINADRTGTALSKTDPGHLSASFVPEEQLANGQIFNIIGADGNSYTLLQTYGEMNGNTGIYEYMLNSDGLVTHQRFIKFGEITGTPNQIVK